jgi:hypothetical protein
VPTLNLTPSPFLEFGDSVGEAKKCPLDAMPVGLAMQVDNLLILALGCLPAGWRCGANLKGSHAIGAHRVAASKGVLICKVEVVIIVSSACCANNLRRPA